MLLETLTIRPPELGKCGTAACIIKTTLRVLTENVALEEFRVDVAKARIFKNSGAIHQDINFVTPIDDCFYDPFRVIDFCDIAADDERCAAGGCNRRRDSGGIFLVAVVMDRNGCAGTAEPGRDSRADATGGPVISATLP